MPRPQRGAAKLVACPTCGKDLTWIPQYERFYCYAEKKYAPKGYGTTPAGGTTIQLGAAGTESHVGHYHCPSCGGELSYITQYDRHYCYAEKKYAPKDLAPITLEAAALPASATPETAVADTLPGAEAAKPEAPKSTEPVISSEVLPTYTGEPPAAAAALEPTPAVIQEKPTTGTEPSPRPETPAGVEAGQPSAEESPVMVAETATAPAAIPQVEEPGRRPALKRGRVKAAKKPQLEEWSRAYGLSTKGNREALRNRLLKYMDDQHISDHEDISIVEASVLPETPAEAVPVREPVVDTPAETVQVTETPSTPEPVETPASTEEPRPASEVLGPEASSAPTADREPEPALQLSPTTETEPLPASEPSPVETPSVEPERITEPEPRSEPASERIPELSLETAGPPPVQVVEAQVQPTPAEATPSMVVEPLAAAAPVAPEARPAEPPFARVEVAKALSCPNCGRELTYISRYDRLYCFSCGRYAPKGYGQDASAVQAARPAAPVVAVATTVQARPIEAPRAVEARPENVCPTCGRTMRYVKEYQRWWCDAERKYAPRRVKNPCPTCGKELSYVRTYDRWYCTYEKRYAPKSYQGAVSVTVERVAGAAAPATVAAESRIAPAAVAMTPTAAVSVPTHAHKKPLAGIALVIVGFSLLVVWLLLLPVIGPLEILEIIEPFGLGLQVYQVLAILGFVGLILAMAGTILGLSSVRAR